MIEVREITPAEFHVIEKFWLGFSNFAGVPTRKRDITDYLLSQAKHGQRQRLLAGFYGENVVCTMVQTFLKTVPIWISSRAYILNETSSIYSFKKHYQPLLQKSIVDAEQLGYHSFLTVHHKNELRGRLLAGKRFQRSNPGAAFSKYSASIWFDGETCPTSFQLITELQGTLLPTNETKCVLWSKPYFGGVT